MGTDDGATTVEVGEVRLAVQAFGDPDDPPVVLVMGATASMLGWPDAFCAALAAERLRVLRYDHRDAGRSTTVPPGAAEHAVEDLADDLLGLVDALGLARAHIVGMSLGGYLGQMLAVAHPARVASLTLVASEPLGWDGPALPHIAPAFLAHFGALATLDWSDRTAVEDFLVETDRLCAGSGAPFDAARARARARQVLSRTDSPASMFNHAALSLREDWTGRVRDIACPVLVVHGTEDPILPPANGRAIADSLPGADIVLLPGTGHEIPDREIPALAARIAAHVRAAGG